MNKDLSYCIVLSQEQLSYQAGVFQERLCHDIASRTGGFVGSGIVLQIGL